MMANWWVWLGGALALTMDLPSITTLTASFPLGNKYNLTVGPRKDRNETGRFLYKNSQTEGYQHCQFCDQKTFQDSTYGYMQQSLCIQNYNGKDIAAQVTEKERNGQLYALCGSGKVPGCSGLPAEVKKSEVMHWYCDPGYSLQNYSVYFSCALICNMTNTVISSYYCNETLEWELDQQSSQKCLAIPAPVVLKENGNSFIIALASVASVVSVLAAVFIIVFCCGDRLKDLIKKRASQHGNERIEMSDVDQAAGQGNPAIRSEIPGASLPETRPLINGQTSTMSLPMASAHIENEIRVVRSSQSLLAAQTTDASSSTDGEGTAEEEALGAVGGLTPAADGKSTSNNQVTKANKEVPKPKAGICIVCWTSRNGPKQSIQPQDGRYSIDEGCNFCILPKPSNGSPVFKFMVSKQNEPFRGRREQQGLFWFTFLQANIDDVGFYKWMICEQDNQMFEGTFEVCLVHREAPRQNMCLPTFTQQSSVPRLNPESLFNERHSSPNAGNKVRAEIHHEEIDHLGAADSLSNELFSDNSHESRRRDSGLNLSSSGSILSAQRSSRQYEMSQVQPADCRLTSTSGYRSQSSHERALDMFEEANNNVPHLDVESMQHASVSRQGSVYRSEVAISYPVQNIYLGHQGQPDVPDIEEEEPLLSHRVPDIEEEEPLFIHRVPDKEEEELLLNHRPDPEGQSSPSQTRESNHHTEPKMPYSSGGRNELLHISEDEDEGICASDERLTSVPISVEESAALLQEVSMEQHIENPITEINSNLHGEMDTLERNVDSQSMNLQICGPHRELDKSANVSSNKPVVKEDSVSESEASLHDINWNNHTEVNSNRTLTQHTENSGETIRSENTVTNSHRNTRW